MKFKKIVGIDDIGFTEASLRKLQSFSAEPIAISAVDPSSSEEVAERMKGADCVLVSWRTPITRRHIEAAPDLKYIGMCCSLYDEVSANVDIAAAKEFQVKVSGVRDYADDGMVELLLAQLIFLLKGIGGLQWQAEARELQSLRMGVIGLGATGGMMARAAQALGVDVVYFSRSRQPDAEERGIRFRKLADLLRTSDVVTTHLPRHTRLLGAQEFALLREGTILINTSIGPTFDVEAFRAWMSSGRNFAIMDAVGAGEFGDEFSRIPRLIFHDLVAGWSQEARVRLAEGAIANVRLHLEAGESSAEAKRSA
ncbi:MAG: dihydrofolate reductase [Deltaproteobacteria bacterium]|nr:dihydrofolate reductase [Deltaproteobacteria bacterium]